MDRIKKIHGMNEIAYAVAMVICAFAVCIGTKANLGISVVAAPGYLFSVILKDYLPWITQGKAEYIWQGIQLVVMCIIITRARAKYLLSFLSSFLGGVLIDMWYVVLGGNGAYESMVTRIIALVVSQILLGFAVSLFFKTTMPIQICELVSVEIAKRFNLKSSNVKLCYDMLMLVISLVLALAFTGALTGIGVGTIIIAFLTAPIANLFGKLWDRFFVFDSLFRKRK